MAEHARLYLTRPDPEAAPLGVRIRLRTDRPLPARYASRVVLAWDGDVDVDLGPLDVPAGEEAQRELDVDLRALEALASHLTRGRHVAQARLVPQAPPFTAPLVSNELVVHVEDGGGGGGGEAPPPAPTPRPEDEADPPPEPAPVPEGPEEEPPEPPRGPESIEVVDPFVRNDARVEKEDAVVAVPDPEAGLAPPPPVPLAEALRAFDRVVEHAIGGERIRPADRAYLLRYFAALRRAAGADEER